MIQYQVPDLFKEYEAEIIRTVRKSNSIVFSAGNTKPWESKLGGCPYLENIEDYPIDDEGKPMMFLAQINLSDLIEMDDFPSKGLLQFYIVSDECYGFEKPCKVRYIKEFTTDISRLICNNPHEQGYKFFLPFEKEGKMNFIAQEMPLSSSCKKFGELFEKVSLNEKQKSDLWQDFLFSGSRVGGYPCFIQNEPAFYEENNVLLLQLDIESECGIMFGDAGNCNFFIKEEDLKESNFTSVAYDWACG